MAAADASDRDALHRGGGAAIILDHADVAKSADAQDSGSCVRKDVEVQLLSSALIPLQDSQLTPRNREDGTKNLTETAASDSRRFSFQVAA